MQTPARAILVTASDEPYFPLAQDLILSVRQSRFAVAFDLGCLDLGLSADSRAWLAAHNVKVVTAKSDIEYPARAVWEQKKPGFRSLTARLFMREYFPDYPVYMWIDADIWVQTPDAINTMLASAYGSPAIHIACELDRCYKTFFDHAAVWHIFRGWYASNFGEEFAAAMTLKPMLNAGAWSMAADSPVWKAWQDIYTSALQRLDDATDKSFMADQLGLNILLYLNKLPHVLMPASFNWLTSYALPMLDPASGMYVEPLPPHRPISQLHLTRQIKDQTETIDFVGGGHIEAALTFRQRPIKRDKEAIVA